MCQPRALKTNMLYLDGSSYFTIGLPILGKENDQESTFVPSSYSHGDSQQMCSSVLENSMQLNTVIYYAELMCKQPHAKAASYYLHPSVQLFTYIGLQDQVSGGDLSFIFSH